MFVYCCCHCLAIQVCLSQMQLCLVQLSISECMQFTVKFRHFQFRQKTTTSSVIGLFCWLITSSVGSYPSSSDDSKQYLSSTRDIHQVHLFSLALAKVLSSSSSVLLEKKPSSRAQRESSCNRPTKDKWGPETSDVSFFCLGTIALFFFVSDWFFH